MKKKFYVFVVFCFSFIFLMNYGCKSGKNFSQTRLALGTVCKISLYEKGTPELYEKLFDRIFQIEKLMSTTIDESEIARLNSASHNAFLDNSDVVDFPISFETYSVLEEALNIAKMTQGAFDPTIGSLVKLWNINSLTIADDGSYTSEVLPSETQIKTAKNFVDYTTIDLHSREDVYLVTLKKRGVQLELGGIAKGYAADELVKILRESGIEKALIDLGGNIYAYGAKSDITNFEDAAEFGTENRVPWKIGIKNPFDGGKGAVAVVSCIDKSVVTSGAYERYFMVDDKRYHHILDSKSGYPCQSDLESVSIISENSMLADSLSTSCFVMGFEKAREFMKTFDDVRYVFIKTDGLVESNCGDELKILDY